MSVYPPADAAAQPVDTVVDGETGKALVFNRPLQALADRAEGLRLSMLHAASANLLTPARGVNDGIKRLNRVANFTALAALAVGSANDGEHRWVDTNESIYRYVHGSIVTADNVFVIGSAAGRWIVVGNGTKGTTPGFAFTNSSGKLIGPSEIQGAVFEYTDLSLNPTSQTLTIEGSAVNNITYVDPTAGALFSVPNVRIGDILDITLSLMMQVTSGSANARGFVMLRCGLSPAGPFTDLHNMIMGPFNNAGNIAPVTLQGRYIAAANGTHIVKPVIATNVTGAPTCNIFSPMRGLVKRMPQ